MANIHSQLEGNHNRRMANMDRNLDALDIRVARKEDAEKMIGELCREGKPVYYVMPVGGRYREGTKVDLADFLVRNNYA